MKIAIQGVRGAFHEEAAREFFSGKDIDIVEKMTFEEVLDSVTDFESDYGMFAIENTIAGTIHSNLNLLRQKDVKICGEIFIRIKQNLAALPGVSINDITEVRSHYMAINQTRQFFRKYPNIKLVECSDTALALREVSEGPCVRSSATSPSWNERPSSTSSSGQTTSNSKSPGRTAPRD